jgi:hypothetical protein
MAIPFHKAVSSNESIKSSIQTDSQVYRWFLMLILTPTVKTKLNAPQDLTLYRRIRAITLAEMALYAGMIAVFVYVFITKALVALLAAVTALIVLQRIHISHRRDVASLAIRLLTLDFPTTLNAQTLFQICEHYAVKLNTPSLVDIITRQDHIGRTTIIYANIFACFIYPMDFWHIWVTILCSFYLVLTIVNTSAIFNRLK